MNKYILLCLSFAILSSCSSPRRSEPFTGKPLQLNEKTSRGQVVFMANCQKCHPGGEGGAGIPLNSFPAPGIAIKLRVRSKAISLGLGRMPSFKKNEISQEDLDNLVAYMKVLRKNKKDNSSTALNK